MTEIEKSLSIMNGEGPLPMPSIASERTVSGAKARSPSLVPSVSAQSYRSAKLTASTNEPQT
jgi:hypothetical protein